MNMETKAVNKQNAGKYKRELKMITEVVEKLNKLKNSFKECNGTEWKYDSGDVIDRLRWLQIGLHELQ